MQQTDLTKQQNTRQHKGHTVAVIGSATWAAKARDVLAEAAIRSEVIKHSSLRTHGGCVYGIRFSAAQEKNVVFVLQRAGIAVREFLESD